MSMGDPPTFPHWPYWPPVTAAPPQGCICPPTSEQTCQSPTCPRKGYVTRTTSGTGGIDPWRKTTGEKP